MGHNLTAVQIVLILGGILLVVGLFVLVVYLLHRAFERQRKETLSRAGRSRPANEAVFVNAALQGVIAKLKARESELNSLLREAEQRAEANSRMLEAIVREFPAGLMVFNQEGLLELANQAARVLLGIDTWSRRRYPEILGAESPVTRLVKQCLEGNRSSRDENVIVTGPTGQTRNLSVTVASCLGRNGQPQGAVCFITRRG
ncbi:MAG: PAS domain-containing protein [Terriglobia bacterium]